MIDEAHSRWVLAIADGTGLATITDDDDPNTPASFSIDDGSVVEGDSLTTTTMRFTITRSGNLAETSSVKYATADGTAVAPGDYAPKALTTIGFGAGQSHRYVDVTIKGDKAVEADETFTLNLSQPLRAGISDGVGTGTIRNDD